MYSFLVVFNIAYFVLLLFVGHSVFDPFLQGKYKQLFPNDTNCGKNSLHLFLHLPKKLNYGKHQADKEGH